MSLISSPNQSPNTYFPSNPDVTQLLCKEVSEARRKFYSEVRTRIYTGNKKYVLSALSKESISCTLNGNVQTFRSVDDIVNLFWRLKSQNNISIAKLKRKTKITRARLDANFLKINHNFSLTLEELRKVFRCFGAEVVNEQIKQAPPKRKLSELEEEVVNLLCQAKKSAK